jgi:hypothetical protein
MRRRAFLAGLAGSAALTGAVATAQESHPLIGTWRGDWGPSPTQRTPVMIYMQWETRKITGVLNPGPNAVPLKVATLDPTKWAVHLEADLRDARGNIVPVIIDGTLPVEDIGKYNRTMIGTWTQGPTKGTFKLRRD